jgi:bifunctional ADP-heptose synthase (sugar kinase/adenylyltransferase)
MSTQQQTKFKILLLGDTCVDVYQYGLVERISPEAPVPIFTPSHSDTHKGMSWNVYTNLYNLGCDIDHHYGVRSCKKTRYIDLKSKQHVLRVDEDQSSKPLNFMWDPLDLIIYDAIVISDYEKGSITYELVENILETYNGPVFIDTKKTDLARFSNAVVKINEKEYNSRTSGGAGVIITKGKNGASYNNVEYPTPQTEAFDVCGAGDTFLAALCYKYLETQDIPTAIQFANLAASVTVKHIGVYAPTLEEIENASYW